MTTGAAPADVVTGGADTHLDVHVAAAVDRIRGVLGPRSSRPRLRATGSCWRSCAGSARWAVSAWRAPAATAPRWPATLARTVCRSSRRPARSGRYPAGTARPTASIAIVAARAVRLARRPRRRKRTTGRSRGLRMWKVLQRSPQQGPAPRARRVAVVRIGTDERIQKYVSQRPTFNPLLRRRHQLLEPAAGIAL
jgi:hypothetical protein